MKRRSFVIFLAAALAGCDFIPQKAETMEEVASRFADFATTTNGQSVQGRYSEVRVWMPKSTGTLKGKPIQHTLVCGNYAWRHRNGLSGTNRFLIGGAKLSKSKRHPNPKIIWRDGAYAGVSPEMEAGFQQQWQDCVTHGDPVSDIG